MPISLCLIVKNEEKSLASCLASFRQLADEIIVVDTGSTDRTKKIAKDFGANVFDYKWKDDFSAARNFSLFKAKKEWVMVADADDIIPKKSVDIIKKYLADMPKKTDVMSLPYIYNESNGVAGNTAWLPRIWRRSLGLKYIYPVHEYLDISKIPSGRIEKINAPVIHKKESHEYKKAFERNIKIMNKHVKQKKDDLRMLYYLIHDNRHLGEYKTAIKWCEKYLKNNTDDAVKVSKVLTLQGMCYKNLKKPLLAGYSFLGAIGANPLLIEPYLELGDYFYRQKKYDEAIQMYRSAENCKMPQKSSIFFNKAAYNYYAQRKLAYILPLVNKNKEALKYAKKVLKFTPNDAKLTNHIKNLKGR